MAWAGTNLDYDTNEVSDVYGPFRSRDEALARIREHAEAEFEEVKEKDPDAEMIDTLDEDGSIEILFGENDGCLYQVLEMEP